MTSPPSAASLSVVLIALSPSAAVSASVDRALARGDISEVRTAIGAFEVLGPAVLAAAREATGDFVLVITPDAAMPEHGWSLIASTAAEPDTDAVRISFAGAGGDPDWRGRRARAHERNLESVRFAQLIAPGALAVRRDLLVACLERLGPSGGDGWWRELVREVARGARVASAPTMVARPRRLEGEPPSPSFARASAQSRPGVLVLGQIEVSTSLFFDFLEDRTQTPVAFRPFTRLDLDAPHLSRAALVVLVRDLHRFWDEGVVELLRSAGAPFVYFTDDNFMALAAEGAASRFYKPARIRRALEGAAEVWCSTPALAEAYAPLHPGTRVWGPVLDPVLAGPASHRERPLTVGMAGGDFRAAGLKGAPLARLRSIAAARPLRIITTRMTAQALEGDWPEAEIVVAPTQRSFRQFIRAWRREGVDILLHPAGATANAPFKCPTAALVAGYLGAVPVVADEPAYLGWGEAEGVVRMGLEAAGLAAVADLARDEAWRADVGERLRTALARRFGGEDREALIMDLLAAPQARQGRVADVLASRSFRRRKAALSLAHAARWMGGLARQG